MSAVDEAVIAPIEKVMGSLPFGEYPLGRAALSSAAGAAFAYCVRPSVSFTEAGQPRPWIMFDSGNPDAAVVPWWAWVALPGVFFGIFV